MLGVFSGLYRIGQLGSLGPAEFASLWPYTISHFNFGYDGKQSHYFFSFAVRIGSGGNMVWLFELFVWGRSLTV